MVKTITSFEADLETERSGAVDARPVQERKSRRVDIIDMVVLWTIGFVIFGLTFLALLGADAEAATALGAAGEPSGPALAVALAAFIGMAALARGMFRHLSKASRITWSDHWR